MRIITGTAGGITLIPADSRTRPLSDRAKMALFAIIQEKIPAATVLDLYAGTGALGLEALSRGASYTVFVDISNKAFEAIHENILRCHMEDCADIIRMDALKYIQKYQDEKFDIIFVCPPYPEVKYHAVKSAASMLNPGGILIFEHHIKDTFKELESLKKVDARTYGIVHFEIYQKR